MLQQAFKCNVLSPVDRATRNIAACTQASLTTRTRQCAQKPCVLIKNSFSLGTLKPSRKIQLAAQQKSVVLAQAGTAAVNATAASEGDNKGSGNG